MTQKPDSKPDPRPVSDAPSFDEEAVADRSFSWVGFLAILVIIGGLAFIGWKKGMFPLPEMTDKDTPADAGEQISADSSSSRNAGQLSSGEALQLAGMKSSVHKLTMDLRQLREENRRLNAALIEAQNNAANSASATSNENKAAETMQAVPVIAVPQTAPEPVSDPAMQASIDSLRAEMTQLRTDQNLWQSHYKQRLLLLALLTRLEQAWQLQVSVDDEDLRQLTLLTEKLGIPAEQAAPLNQLASNPPLTLGALTVAYSAQAQEAVPVAIFHQENTSFSDRMRARMAHLISIRKVEVSTTPQSDEELIALAEEALNSGSVVEARQLLAALSPATRAAMLPWIQQADAYLALQSSFATLRQQLLMPDAGTQGGF